MGLRRSWAVEGMNATARLRPALAPPPVGSLSSSGPKALPSPTLESEELGPVTKCRGPAPRYPSVATSLRSCPVVACRERWPSITSRRLTRSAKFAGADDVHRVRVVHVLVAARATAGGTAAARPAIFTDILKLFARVLTIQGGKRGSIDSESDPAETVLPRVPVGPRRCGRRAPDCRHSARACAWSIVATAVRGRAMRPRSSMGTSRRMPIGWSPRVLGVRRPRGTPGPPAPRPQCRSTSRPASVLETRNAAARGCVDGRRTSPNGGWSQCYRVSGGRAI